MALIMIGIGTALALFIAGTTLFQHRLLYFPSTASIAEMSSASLSPWPGIEQFRGLLAEAEPATERSLEDSSVARDGSIATVIVFHGNAGHAAHRDYYVRLLNPLGLRVILAEYPGYGPREGELGERSLVDDAEQTILQAHQHFGGPLLLVGESLGAGVAAAAGARVPAKVDGLLLITPWDRLAHVAAHHYPWLPVRWLLRDRYDTVSNLQAFRKPIVVVLAAQDAIVPARFGSALHDALSGPKELVILQDAGHNDWPARVDSQWWRETIQKLLGPR